jgi:hypothetical protein
MKVLASIAVLLFCGIVFYIIYKIYTISQENDQQIHVMNNNINHEA